MNLTLSLAAGVACGWLLAGTHGVFAQEGQPATDVEGKAETKTQAETEAKTKLDQQQSDTEAEDKSQVESKTEAKTQQKQDTSAKSSETQGQAEQQGNIEADVKARQDSQTEESPETQGEAKAEAQTEARGEAEAQSRPEREGPPRQRQPRGQSEREGRSRIRGEFDQQDSRFGREDVRGDANLGLQFEGDSEEELVISNVARNSLAAEAGLRPGDRIISVDGRRFSSHGELNTYLHEHTGRQMPIVVLRDGRRQRISLTPRFADRDPRFERRFDDRGRFGPPRRETFRRPQAERRGALGVTLRDGRNGVLLSAVHRGSPAFRAGLRHGDEIARVNRRRVCGTDRLISTLRQVPPGEPVAVGFYRNGRYRSADVRLAPWEQAFAGEPIPMFRDGQRIAERRFRGRVDSGAEFRQAPPEAEAEVPGPPQPPSEGRDSRRTARGSDSGQSRTALRPDIDTLSRIEDMQKQIESLQQEVDSLRNQVQQLRGEQPDGSEVNTPPVPPEQAPGDEAEQEGSGTSPEKGQELGQQRDQNPDKENRGPSNPDEPEPGV